MRYALKVGICGAALAAVLGAGGCAGSNQENDDPAGTERGTAQPQLWSQAARKAQRDGDEQSDDINKNGAGGSVKFSDWKPGAHTVPLFDDAAYQERARLEAGREYTVSIACGGMRDIVIAGIGNMHMGVPLKCPNDAKTRVTELHGITLDAVGEPELNMIFRVPDGRPADGHLGWHVSLESAPATP